MRILVACEFSGIVREAFRRRGHDAWSCDLLPTEIPGNHIQGDVLEILNDGWDLMIAHPPCTYLSSSGMHWTTRGLRDPSLTEDALDFVKTLLNAPIKNIALENPIGVISSRIRKPDQIIQPWMFGDDASKQTCLWLKNLPKLSYTKIIPPKGYKLVKFSDDMPLCPDCEEEAFCEEHGMHFADCDCYGPTQDGIEYRVVNGVLFGTDMYPFRPIWGNQTPGGQNKLGPSPERAKERSRTYQGIAEAMAEQWG
jgi:hypothetical protein